MEGTRHWPLSPTPHTNAAMYTNTQNYSQLYTIHTYTHAYTYPQSVQENIWCMEISLYILISINYLVNMTGISSMFHIFRKIMSKNHNVSVAGQICSQQHSDCCKIISNCVNQCWIGSTLNQWVSVGLATVLNTIQFNTVQEAGCVCSVFHSYCNLSASIL